MRKLSLILAAIVAVSGPVGASVRPVTVSVEASWRGIDGVNRTSSSTTLYVTRPDRGRTALTVAGVILAILAIFGGKR